MKILLDENIPTKVKYDFGEDYEVRTVRDMDWLGKKNVSFLGLAAFKWLWYFYYIGQKLKESTKLK